MNVILSCLVLTGCFFETFCMGGNMIGEGVWDVLAVNDCENPEQYKNKVTVLQSKINRTLVGFHAKMDIKQPINSEIGVKVVICKWVDGGCKEYQVLKDSNMVDFTNKMAEKNRREAFTLMNIENGDFPIAEGEYECQGYPIDYCEFPCESVIGIFDAELTLQEEEKAVACIKFTIEFREVDDPDLLCPKCKE